MPRKRMIDPEFWSDEEISQWTHTARLFYIGLWNFADDEGRFKSRSELLRSQIFPYERKINIDKLKKEISNKIQWYENNGFQYGHIRNFLKYQRIDRPTVSKIPSPFDEGSTKACGDLVSNISKEKISKDKGVTFPFDKIWEKYPNPVGKKDAERHFNASVKTEQDWKDINQALKNYCASDKVKKGYIMNGSTFFNNWRDYINYKDIKPTQQQTKNFTPLATAQAPVGMSEVVKQVSKKLREKK